VSDDDDDDLDDDDDWARPESPLRGDAGGWAVAFLSAAARARPLAR
jgi:hypothetical protein